MKARFFRALVWIFTAALLLQATPIVPAEELPSTEDVSAEEVRIVEEGVSKRTENTKTYRCSDGSYTPSATRCLITTARASPGRRDAVWRA